MTKGGGVEISNRKNTTGKPGGCSPNLNQQESWPGESEEMINVYAQNVVWR